MNTLSRHAMVISCLVVAVWNPLVVQAAGVPPVAVDQQDSIDGFMPFIVCGASTTSQELVVVRFHRENGKLRSVIQQREPLGFDCAPVAYHHHRRLICVTSSQAKEEDGNKLAVFSVGPDGGVTPRGKHSMKHGSAYVSFDRTGQFMLSVSYFEGHVDVYRLTEIGRAPVLTSTTFEGRDEAHSILTSPSNQFAYVPYVKDNNALFQYSFDEKNGKLLPLDPPQVKIPSGIGPRHVAFHPTRPFIFFSNEQQLGVTSLRITEGGQLRLIEVCRPGNLRPSMPLAASDIVITPDGRYLFIGVRDFGKKFRDSIHRYCIHEDGHLSHLGSVDADAIPWGLKISPDGHHLFVTAAHGNTLTAFEISDGNLEKHTSVKWGNMIRDIAVVICE